MYKESVYGVIRLSDNASIPRDETNTDYADYLMWLSEGNTPKCGNEKSADEIMVDFEARLWRNNELTRADVVLNRIQDGETGLGTQKAWRAYRVELRNWPETELFPMEKPVAPDAK